MIEHQRPLLPQSSFVIRRSPMVGNMAQQSHSSCVGKYVFCDPSNLQHDNDHSSKARVPVWVNRYRNRMTVLRPLFPRKRPNGGHRRMPQMCQQATSAWNERGRQLRRASLILDAIFCYFNARLLQYHELSLPLQPTSSETSVHS